jgi:hypothetical protein
MVVAKTEMYSCRGLTPMQITEELRVTAQLPAGLGFIKGKVECEEDPDCFSVVPQSGPRKDIPHAIAWAAMQGENPQVHLRAG